MLTLMSKWKPALIVAGRFEGHFGIEMDDLELKVDLGLKISTGIFQVERYREEFLKIDELNFLEFSIFVEFRK